MTPRIAVVGAGLGGIGMACELKRHGYRDVTIFERGQEVGGVWSANTYPGAACDVPAQLYSFSFAPNLRWSSNYPPQAEIQRYAERVATDFGVRPQIRFGTTVRAADWVDGRWELETDPGGRETFDVVLFALGQLSTPAWPAVPGRGDFAGTSFHSAQWDHGADLDGKRIGVIGTGASAIQFVPHLARRAAHLTLFQRSAPWIIPKHEVRFDRGPIRDGFGRNPVLQRVSRALTYAAFESRAIGFTSDPRLLGVIRKGNAKLLAAQVPDPVRRAQLAPTDVPGCKRILTSNEYYPAVAGSGVNIVTSDVEAVTASGVHTADGRDHDLDVLVYGTGFAANEFLPGVAVRGRDGVEIHDRWRAVGGAESARGGTVAGYPNLAMLYGPNTNLGHNSIIYMIESQYRHVLGLLAELDRRGGGAFEPRTEAQDAWNAWVSERMQRTAFVAGCHSWYANAGGKHTNNWPSYTPAYRRSTRSPDPAEYDFA